MELRGGSAAQRCERGFTLIELLIVISVIALLVAIALPSYRNVREMAYDTMCRANLRHLSEALLSWASDNRNDMPTPYRWMDIVSEKGCAGALTCPKGIYDDVIPTAGLEDVFILQFHFGGLVDHDVCYVSDLLAGGSMPDPQIWVRYPANGIDQPPRGGWPAGSIPPLAQNQAFIGIDNDAGVRMTIGEVIIIESWTPPEPGHSRHWVMRGAGTIRTPLPGGESPGDEDDMELLRLYGWDYTQIDPRSPLTLAGEEGMSISYGMNCLVGAQKHRPTQIMLMDARFPVLDVDPTGNYMQRLEYVVAPRHWDGHLNVVDVRGSVRRMRFEELEEEVEKTGGLWYPSGSSTGAGSP